MDEYTSPSRAVPVSTRPTVFSVFYSGVFGISFFLAYKQAFAGLGAERYASDLPLHLFLAERYFEGTGGGTHPGFHLLLYVVSRVTSLSLEHSAALILALATVATAAIIHRLLTRNQEPGADHTALTMTLVLLAVSAIYVPFFNPTLYVGQGSPNTWHNPTMTVMKPLAFLAFLFLLNALRRPTVRASLWPSLAAGAALAASAVVKPSFALVFIPAAILLTAIERRPNLLGRVLLVILPCTVLLAVQYAVGYSPNGTPETIAGTAGADLQLYANDRIVFDFLGVWRSKTPCVPVSLFLGIAFPLSVLVFRFRHVVRNRPLALSWLMTLIGLLLYSLLAEQTRISHGNFGWSYLSAMSFLFVFSAIEYRRWLQPAGRRPRLESVGIGLTSVLLSLHFVSGVYYLLKLLLGGHYS